MTRSSKRPLSSILSLLLLACLFLGACSGGGDGGSASTPPASTPLLRPLAPHPRPHRPWRSSFNKVISKRQIPMLTIIFGYNVALSGDTLVVGAPQEGSSATGVNGNQANNSAARQWSRLCVHAYRWGLDAAGLSQGLEYRRRGPVRGQRGDLRRHACGGRSV